MWFNLANGQHCLKVHYDVNKSMQQGQERLIDQEHVQSVANHQLKLQAYDKYLLQVRQRKHRDRVSKTKYIKKFLRQTSPFESNNNFTFAATTDNNAQNTANMDQNTQQRDYQSSNKLLPVN